MLELSGQQRGSVTVSSSSLDTAVPSNVARFSSIVFVACDAATASAAEELTIHGRSVLRFHSGSRESNTRKGAGDKKRIRQTQADRHTHHALSSNAQPTKGCIASLEPCAAGMNELRSCCDMATHGGALIASFGPCSGARFPAFSLHQAPQFTCTFSWRNRDSFFFCFVFFLGGGRVAIFGKWIPSVWIIW